MRVCESFRFTNEYRSGWRLEHPRVLMCSATSPNGNLQLACWKGLSRGARRREEEGGNIIEGKGSAEWGWDYGTRGRRD